MQPVPGNKAVQTSDHVIPSLQSRMDKILYRLKKKIQERSAEKQSENRNTAGDGTRVVNDKSVAKDSVDNDNDMPIDLSMKRKDAVNITSNEHQPIDREVIDRVIKQTFNL